MFFFLDFGAEENRSRWQVLLAMPNTHFQMTFRYKSRVWEL